MKKEEKKNNNNSKNNNNKKNNDNMGNTSFISEAVMLGSHTRNCSRPVPSNKESPE